MIYSILLCQGLGRNEPQPMQLKRGRNEDDCFWRSRTHEEKKKKKECRGGEIKIWEDLSQPVGTGHQHFFFTFYWGIVDIPYYINFRSTA